ncbi:MAG TPA: glycosyltransferase family 39 protein [Gaiellaceae bacterium]|nr:glycosyltransferase family 39 protein [Gaiellaceae bacterium]
MASREAVRIPGVAVAARWEEALESRWATPVILVALTALSLLVRTRQLNAGFWIDEGISVGLAHHHWSSIPSLLRQDGSPPAYYMLLGLWIRVFGDSERATHTLSLLFGLGCIPLAFATARSLFDRRTGLVCALLAALDPFLTYYAQETRMYELEAFLSFVIAYAYVQGVLRGRTLWAALLVPAVSLMLYTHNWGLFVCIGLAVTTAVFARERLKLFALVTLGIAVLYGPWLPTLLSQAKHTGAPWSTAPSVRDLVLSPMYVLGGEGALLAVVLVGGAGLVEVVRRRVGEERRIVLALATFSGVTIVAAFISSQLSPAWTARYFSVILGPVLLLGARGLVRAGRLGVVALVAVVFLWSFYSVRDDKENARSITAGVAPYLHPGELVISTHPEQAPVLRYYLGPGLRWANTLGPVRDPQVFDWRDAVTRLEQARAKPTLDQLLATVPPGGQFVVITPVFRDYRAWRATWTKLVWQKSTAWTWLLQRDPRVKLVAHVATVEIAVHKNYFKPLQAFVYRKVG